MAATDTGRRLTERHRRSQALIRARTVIDSKALMALLDPENVAATTPRWMAANERLVAQMRAASEEQALRYLVALKDAEVGSRDVAWQTRPMDVQKVRTSLTVTGPAVIRGLSARGVPVGQAFETATVAVAGSVSRHVLNGGRGGIMESARRDPAVRGWQRVGSGKPCAFCSMLISRGPVYRNEGTSSFEAHDHCGCTAEPIYRADAEWTPQAEQMRDLWQEATQGEDDPLNAFRRALGAA